MKNNKKHWLILSTFLTFLVSLPPLLISCGGGSQGSSAGMGTVAVLVKDDHQVILRDGQESITITDVRIKISQILLKKEREPEGTWVEVPLNDDILQPFNLLDLHNNVAMLAAIGQVESGVYVKARLVLHESFTPYIIVQRNTEQGTITETVSLKVPSHKVDIILTPHVLIPEGNTTSIVLDFAPDKSIHIVQTDSRNEYILRPVIRAVTAEFPDGIRAHNEISGVVETCTPNTLELSLRHDTVHVTIHYDNTTQFFSDEHVDSFDNEGHIPLTTVTCSNLLGKKVEVKVLAMPDGALHAVRVEIKGEFPEIEEFQISGTLAANSSLTLHTLTRDYKVAFPEGTIRVEGRLAGEQAVQAREIETQSVAEDFEVIGLLQPADSSLTLTADDKQYTITFPRPPLIKVEGTLNTTTTPYTITAREIEVFP